MNELFFPPRRVNLQTLDAELRTGLGDTYSSLISADSGIRVFVHEDVQVSDIAVIFDAHDPDVLTMAQSAEIQRQQAISDARAQFKHALDMSAYNGETDVIQQLANRLAWLEQEIRDLRGL